MQPDKKRILCVSAEPDQGEMLALWFKTQGYEMVIAATVTEGCHYLKESGYDLVLFDDWLRGRAEFIAAIQACDSYTPLIVFSTSPQWEAEFRALEAGAQAFVRVPFDLRQLTETVARLIACQPPARPEIQLLLAKCEGLQRQSALAHTQANMTSARAIAQIMRSQELCQKARSLVASRNVRSRRRNYRPEQ